MPKQRSWTDEQLKIAVENNYSVRAVVKALGLIPAGGNYTQVTTRIEQLKYSTNHFTGARWNKGKTYHTKIRPSLNSLLIQDIAVQSYKLKKRLFEEMLKKPECELCGWAQISSDGRIPVELDHVNGNPRDNRIENLRILCPNCHSLQPTHRGRNKKNRYARVVE